MTLSWVVIALAGLASALLTRWLCEHARTRQWLDLPNARSSHSHPTPRGGGLAIVLCFLVGGSALALAQGWPAQAWIGVLGAGLAVAAVGWIDDLGHVPARWRLLVHAVAAAWALFWLGGMPPVPWWTHPLDLGWAGQVLGMLGLVWLLNLYNFMDGIDGIAGMQAVTVGLAAAMLHALCLPGSGAWVPPMLLAACAAGFLWLNLPPARIFMGDVGSGFVGIVLGILALQAASASAALLASWMILLGVFIVDASVTLLRRLLAGQPLAQAHRSHAYQRMARAWGSHGRVTAGVGLVNLLWLAPLAVLVGLQHLPPLAGVALAWAPLAAVALHWRAGVAGEAAS